MSTTTKKDKDTDKAQKAPDKALKDKGTDGPATGDKAPDKALKDPDKAKSKEDQHQRGLKMAMDTIRAGKAPVKSKPAMRPVKDGKSKPRVMVQAASTLKSRNAERNIRLANIRREAALKDLAEENKE
jgi:hypothetical protein